MNWLEKQKQFPPILYRITASHRGVAIGPDQIASRSGLSRSTVQRISAKKSFESVSFGHMCRFISGCGYEVGSFKKIMQRLRVVQEHGLRGLKHLDVPSTAPLWKRGANGNRLKLIARVLSQ